MPLFESPDVLVDEVRLWDGTGAPAQSGLDILISHGLIAAIADEIPRQDGARVIDGSGLTAMPGLIDAHVHLSLDPGGALRTDTPEARDALLKQHLAGYLACGVTTILDPAVTHPEWERIEGTLASGAPGPRYLSLGPPLSPPSGYVSIVLPEFPSVATPSDVDAHLDRLVESGAAGAKVTVEPGMVRPIWPIHTDEMFAAIRASAQARDLPLYVHARTDKTQRIAVELLDAHALVHGLDKPSEEAIARVAEAGVYVMPTLSILDSTRAAWQPERLDAPLIARATPPLELATARDPKAVRGFAKEMTATVMPHAPAKGLVAGLALRESVVGARLGKQLDAVRAMRDAGVPLVLGSDSGNWPIFPFLFHGPTTIRELELMVEAGLSPQEALLAATKTPAEMLGRAGQIGRIAPGAAADVLLVRGDPLANIAAMRDLAWVISEGQVETPDGWMTARRIPPTPEERRFRVTSGPSVLELSDTPGPLVDATAPPPPPGEAIAPHPFLSGSCAGDPLICSQAGEILRASPSLEAFLEALRASGWQIEELTAP